MNGLLKALKNNFEIQGNPRIYKNPAVLNIIESYFFNQTEVHI